MAFRLQARGETARTLHAGKPTQAMLDSDGYAVLDALGNPWGTPVRDPEALAEADARLEAKLANPKANGWKRVDELPAAFR